jgi:hypothetical protein
VKEPPARAGRPLRRFRTDVALEVIRTLPLSRELEDYFGYDSLGLFVRNAELLDVDGVLVDVENILRRHFRCDGTWCLHAERCPGEDSHGRAAGDCCHEPYVPLTAHERDALLEHLPHILPYMEPAARQSVEERLPQYPRDPGLVFCHPVCVSRRPAGLWAVRHQPNGDCLFRFVEQADGHTHVRCAIHAYLLRSGRPLWGIKPLNCWVWPLAFVPLYDGHMLLTMHTPETHMFTCESRPKASRHCLLVQPPDAPLVYQAFEQELRQVFGEPFYDHLLQAVAAQEPALAEAQARTA